MVTSQKDRAWVILGPNLTSRNHGIVRQRAEEPPHTTVIQLQPIDIRGESQRMVIGLKIEIQRLAWKTLAGLCLVKRRTCGSNGAEQRVRHRVIEFYDRILCVEDANEGHPRSVIRDGRGNHLASWIAGNGRVRGTRGVGH